MQRATDPEPQQRENHEQGEGQQRASAAIGGFVVTHVFGSHSRRAASGAGSPQREALCLTDKTRTALTAKNHDEDLAVDIWRDRMTQTAQPPRLGRRGFVMTSLMTGFTLATARAETMPA
jgi:hypothetical protein